MPFGNAAPIRVLVADDHGLMLEAIVKRLNGDPDVEIIATVEDGGALVDAFRCFQSAGGLPDVVVSDYDMPILNGLEAMRAILTSDPAARFLFLSDCDNPAVVVAAIAAGAVGFLLKSVPPEQLSQKVRMAAKGEPVFDAHTARYMVDALRHPGHSPGGTDLLGTPLSKREIEVLRLVSDGLSNNEVGAHLYISAQTVKTHLERICRRLGVSGRAAAVKRGMEIGVLRIA